jgi:glycosyltransferase involved in cell wall biosynthesis
VHVAILGTRGIPLGYSGYETLASELSLYLVEHGHRVTVYAHRSMFRSRPKYYHGARILYFPGLRGKNTAQFSHSLLTTLDVIFRRPDVAFFCNVANGPFGFLVRLARIPCVINVDGLEWRRPKWGRLAQQWFRFGARCASRLFHRVVTDATGMQEIYLREFHCPSTLIAYGANLVIPRNPSLLERFSLTSRGFFLVVCRLVPDNNVDLIVRAYKQSGSKKKLLVVGGTVYKNEYQENLQLLAGSGVVFCGYIHDQDLLNELYCHAYACIHGHEFGGTNPSLLRALGAGCCVLALDTVFNREVLVDGQYGLLFKKDEGALAGLMQAVEADETRMRALRKMGPERIRQNYTWDKICGQYMEVFISLVEGKKGIPATESIPANGAGYDQGDHERQPADRSDRPG